MNREQRKRRHARRVQHQKTTAENPILRSPTGKSLGYVKDELGVDLLPYQEAIVEKVFATRATCPECGFRHKVRKDGSMTRHDVFVGSRPQECAGTGQPSN